MLRNDEEEIRQKVVERGGGREGGGGGGGVESVGCPTIFPTAVPKQLPYVGNPQINTREYQNRSDNYSVWDVPADAHDNQRPTAVTVPTTVTILSVVHQNIAGNTYLSAV